MKPVRQAALLALLVVVCLLPFSDKPLHVDDPLFFWTAQQIRESPLDPYGFDVNWLWMTEPMYRVTKNPPAAGYFIALVQLTGDSLRALHLGFLLPAVGLILGVFGLARRVGADPAIAAATASLSPVFLVSSTSIMSDTLMLCFWTWAILLWVSGLDRDSRSRLTWAALLIVLAAITKYFAVVLVPLLGVYAAYRKRSAGYWIAALAISVVLLSGYETWSQAKYDVGLLSDAAAYAVQHGTRAGFAVKALKCLAFTGGCLLPLLFWLPKLVSRRALAIGGFAAVGLAVVLALARPDGMVGLLSKGDPSLPFAAQFAILAVVGAFAIWLPLADFQEHGDAESLLLGLWLVGTFVFAGFVNWTLNGRSVLPMLPAVALLVGRRLAERGTAGRYWPALLAPAAILALTVTAADHSLAVAGRKAAVRIVSDHRPAGGTIWFQGHWGFQFYMERAGARAMEFQRVDFAKGDIVAVPINGTNNPGLPAGRNRIVERIEIPAFPWATTLQQEVGGGFYSDKLGGLPFYFGAVPAERYDVHQMTDAVRGRMSIRTPS